MDALSAEPGATDPDIAATLTTGEITLSMTVEAETDWNALGRALTIARSAIHAAGGFTPDWDKPTDGGFTVTDGFDARVRPTAPVC